MTKKELIELLAPFPDDTKIVTVNGSGHCKDIELVERKPIVLNHRGIHYEYNHQTLETIFEFHDVSKQSFDICIS